MPASQDAAATDDPRIQPLLDRWHALRARGQQPSVDELCADCPELKVWVLACLPTQDVPASVPLEIGEHQPPLGRQVAGYEIVDELGRGGFGQVWRARGPGGVHVAMKFVPLDQKAAEFELRSLDAMRSVRHPHLLGTFGAWQIDGWLVIAMELADGTLAERASQLQSRGGIPHDELLRYLDEAAKGIDHLNDVGIQHRDVKPQNLLLVGDGVKVADFGLAKFLEHSVASNTGAMTPAYAAPEYLEGKTTTKSDQYALALTYCQLRGGRLPFTGSVAQILDGHRCRPPDLSMLPTLGERAAVARALAKEPAHRWPTCQVFVQAIVNGSKELASVRAPLSPNAAEPLPDSAVRPYDLLPTGESEATAPSSHAAKVRVRVNRGAATAPPGIIARAEEITFGAMRFGMECVQALPARIKGLLIGLVLLLAFIVLLLITFSGNPK